MKILTFHSPITPNKKRYTVVGVIEDREITLGVSVCSPKDHFIRKRGREIAMGRAMKGKGIKMYAHEDKKLLKENFYNFALSTNNLGIKC